MAELPTIAIATDDRPEGWMLINAADYNPQQHRLYDGVIHGEPEPEPEPEAEASGPLVEPSDRLDQMNLTQLRALASTEKIKGRSKMDEAQLIAALQGKGYEL